MWANPQFPVDLVAFTEESLMGNFIFCAVIAQNFKPLLCETKAWKIRSTEIKVSYDILPFSVSFTRYM